MLAYNDVALDKRPNEPDLHALKQPPDAEDAESLCHFGRNAARAPSRAAKPIYGPWVFGRM